MEVVQQHCLHLVFLLNQEGRAAQRHEFYSDATSIITVRYRDGQVSLEPKEVPGWSHASIKLTDSKAVLLDLGTKNGTRVNGRTVHRHALGEGDTIQIGTVKLLVLQLCEASTSRPAPALSEVSSAVSAQPSNVPLGGPGASPWNQTFTTPAAPPPPPPAAGAPVATPPTTAPVFNAAGTAGLVRPPPPVPVAAPASPPQPQSASPQVSQPTSVATPAPPSVSPQSGIPEPILRKLQHLPSTAMGELNNYLDFLFQKHGGSVPSGSGTPSMPIARRGLAEDEVTKTDRYNTAFLRRRMRRQRNQKLALLGVALCVIGVVAWFYPWNDEAAGPDVPVPPGADLPAAGQSPAALPALECTLRQPMSAEDIARSILGTPTQRDTLAKYNAKPFDGVLPAGSTVRLPEFRPYAVQPGDTLGKIAERLLGDPKAYVAIKDANQGPISDPSLIDVGMRVAVPLENSISVGEYCGSVVKTP